MNLRKIKIHRKCCDMLLEAGLNKKITERCSEQRIIKGAGKILENKATQQIRELKIEMQEQFLENPKLQSYILGLFRKGVSAVRCNSVLEKIEADTLIGYEIDRVAGILSDNRISNEFLEIYLRYYRNINFTEPEKARLRAGIDNYFSCRKDMEDTFLTEHSWLLYCELVSSGFLLKLQDYDTCLKRMAEDEAVFAALQAVFEISGYSIQIDDDTFQQIAAEPVRIGKNLRWAEAFFTGEEKPAFIKLLVENHSLQYDLETLRRKAESGHEMEAHRMVKDRIAYLSFFYNNPFIGQWRGEYMEGLIIYAISRKKKAFLRLIQENTDIFMSLPCTSVLFQAEFYSHIVNINSLNRKNLMQCGRMKNCPAEILEIFYDKDRTFQEFAILYDMSAEYAKLYFLLEIPRVDDRIRVIREIIHAGCLKKGMDLAPIAGQLSVRPFSQWMQKIFSHIEGLEPEVGLRLLENYDRIGHLVQDVRTAAEARYITCSKKELLCHPEGRRTLEDQDMEGIREAVLRENPEWLKLRDEFQLTDEFIAENEARIRSFIFNDGAHIIWTYLQQMRYKSEELRRLVYAELTGRFRELKYFGNDLEKELDYPVSELDKNVWMKNLREEKGDLWIWEEDGLLPVMRIGEVPRETCLSYKTGVYKECLLACHDSNKKVLYLSWKGKIVLRAAIRLTKGFFGKAEHNKKQPAQLEFADLSDRKDGEGEKQKREKLVLFLEKAYVAGIPEKMQKPAAEMIFQLMEQKAKLLNALLVASTSYLKWKPERMHYALFSVYISRSKAGSQYLDSLDGSQSVVNEGSYQTHNFLLE